MYFVPFLRDCVFNQFSSLFLKGKPVGTVNGLVVVTKDEQDEIVRAAEVVWQELSKNSHFFQGLVRFDFIPEFSLPKAEEVSWQGYEAYDLGSFKIKGIYEVNAHSPECGAAISAFHDSWPDIAKMQPSVADRIGRVIKGVFGKEKIAFCSGSGPVKDDWGESFKKNLILNGVNLISMTPEEVAKIRPEIIWRWGDAREEGPSEYPEWFIKWLKKYDKGTVFNTIPFEGDFSDKRHLIPSEEKSLEFNSLVGENIFLDFNYNVENQENWVLKPFRGSSGNGIVFGRMKDSVDWQVALKESSGCGNYGLYQARWLPKVIFPDSSEMVFDISPAFWVEGKSLEYLYTLVRADEWENYWRRGLINIAQGAGIAGAAIEE